MKKYYYIFLFAIFVIACNKNNETNKEIINADKEALTQAIADRDSLLSLVNDISSDITQIKALEQIITVSGSLGNEGVQQNKIKEDIEALKMTLQQRQEKLDKLEKKLKNSKLSNSKLEKTIATLRTQIENQKVEIDSLTKELSIAKEHIGALEKDNDSLAITIHNVSAEKEAIEEVANQAINNINELNQCYYAIGSKKELKDKKILESGFLKKTKLMQGDFDNNFFNIADKRTTININLHSNKAKVLTNHPSDSYSIIEQDGQKILLITNPKDFWNLSNYLVIQVD